MKIYVVYNNGRGKNAYFSDRIKAKAFIQQDAREFCGSTATLEEIKSEVEHNYSIGDHELDIGSYD